MAMPTKQDLEDEIKARERRILELREEIDELRERNQELRTHAKEWQEVFEQWREAFEMVLDDNDMWSWDPFVAERDAVIGEYIELRRDYNKLVSDYNAVVRAGLADGILRDGGRPVAAPARLRSRHRQVGGRRGRALRNSRLVLQPSTAAGSGKGINLTGRLSLGCFGVGRLLGAQQQLNK
jgi:hypothetical protein